MWMMDHIMNNRLSLEFGQTYARSVTDMRRRVSSLELLTSRTGYADATQSEKDCHEKCRARTHHTGQSWTLPVCSSSGWKVSDLAT